MTHSEIVWQGVWALVTILTVIATYLKTRSQRREQHAENVERLNDVQRVVNGQSERQQARIAELEQALVDAGATVPPPPPPAG